MTTKSGLATITRVDDIMTHRVVTVASNQSVSEAAQILNEHQVSGAPVLQGARVVGVVSQTNLVDPRTNQAGPVTEAMTKALYAVRASDPALLAVQLMVDENVHRVLVLGEDHRLIGIVVPMDVCRAVRADRPLSMTSSERVHLTYVDLGVQAVQPAAVR